MNKQKWDASWERARAKTRWEIATGNTPRSYRVIAAVELYVRRVWRALCGR